MFDPTIYKTDCCNDVIFSSYEGEFVPCKCGKTFIDETKYYARHSGGLLGFGKLSNYTQDGDLRYIEQENILFQKITILNKEFFTLSGLKIRPWNEKLDDSILIGIL